MPDRRAEPGTMPAGIMVATVAGAIVLALLGSPAVGALRARGGPADPVDGVESIVAGAGARSPEDQPTVGPGVQPAPGARDAVLRLPAPTPDRPLRLWIGGDRTSIETGFVLQQMAERSGLFRVTREARNVPDWPAHLTQDVAGPGGSDPDVAVVMIGDDERGGPEALRQRTAAAMDALRRPDGDRLVMWVGRPVTAPGAGIPTEAINAVYADEAARRPWVRYVDASRFLSDPFGRYAAELANADGRTRVMRAPDGIGLTEAGGARLARAVYARLGTLIDLRASPLAPDPAQSAPANVTER
jgi:uncharacterized protein